MLDQPNQLAPAHSPITSSTLPERSFDDLTYATDMFSGFEQLMELIPNASAAGFAAHGSCQILEEPQSQPETDAAVPEDSAASVSNGRGIPSEHKHVQQLNKLAQKRFRERQKVCEGRKGCASTAASEYLTQCVICRREPRRSRRNSNRHQHS